MIRREDAVMHEIDLRVAVSAAVNAAVNAGVNAVLKLERYHNARNVTLKGATTSFEKGTQTLGEVFTFKEEKMGSTSFDFEVSICDIFWSESVDVVANVLMFGLVNLFFIVSLIGLLYKTKIIAKDTLSWYP